MELHFTPEEIAFRDEVRAFFRAALPADIRTKMVEGRELEKEELVRWQRILNAKGWAVPHWPTQWGGTGWSPIQRYIFLEESFLAPAPQPLPFNVTMIGPVLIAFGTEEQKRRFLPRIANMDDWWCQGFSEPNAGSDLASLRTSAVRDGDHYIVNGQKTWTTLAQNADWMFCLVRTDPTAKKQAGISFLLIDMTSPGIAVHKLETIDGRHQVNEVFLENVRVHVSLRVHDENKGWDCAKFLLGNERTGIARVGLSKARLRRARELARTIEVDGRMLAETDSFRRKAAAIEVELKALEVTQLRAISRQQHGSADNKPDPFGSILKLRGTELQQATLDLLRDVAGPLALPAEDVAEAGWAGPVLPNYFYGRAASIYGGSNEIQRNIIARAFLGL